MAEGFSVAALTSPAVGKGLLAKAGLMGAVTLLKTLGHDMGDFNVHDIFEHHDLHLAASEHDIPGTASATAPIQENSQADGTHIPTPDDENRSRLGSRHQT